ncbi:MAG: acetoacetate--CoA ligase [Gemmatimonadota bacterium]|nr:acetoacetate--CoA ligase [Gemmatimonadota bacterium]
MEPIWRPSPAKVRDSNITHFIESLRESRSIAAGESGVPLPYGILHQWSVRNPEVFWRAVASYCGLICDGFDESVCIGLDRMAPPDDVLGPKWFEGATLNFAENLLRFCDDRPAIISWNERGRQQELTFAELRGEVSRIASAFRDMGVRVGDRVAGFLPNLPETIIAMLAATSLGAVWSSCSPDFGVQGVVDRFGQIEPKVLVCADGYRYAGKQIDCLERAREICGRIPSIANVIIVPYVNEHVDPSVVPNGVRWDSLRRVGETPPFVRLPFDHPLYVMYSSGTTGLPKCMVHGAGGTLLQHLKELVLHTDLDRDDRMFYFTTCGWMMWNWMVSSLAVGATIVLYDGAALQPRRPGLLWDMIAAERVTVFGTSAKYLALAEKAGLTPASTHDLSALSTILSTGSPLAEHSYDYVYRDVKPDVHLASISGGTDIISCFALGNPAIPVYRGELQCRALGMAVEVFDASGNSVAGVPGELVCTHTFPSMPIRFWGDPDGSKYRAAYFDVYPNVWRHGDWAELTAHDGVIIYGRSDATLNPGGVRIGTAEIYRQVEQMPEVIESVAIGQEIGEGIHGDVRIVLFVRLRDGMELSDDLSSRIRTQIRSNTTPLHVPKVVIQVADIPRTVSGKISEIAVREVVHGRQVRNVEALANPQALELFRGLDVLQR